MKERKKNFHDKIEKIKTLDSLNFEMKRSFFYDKS